MNKYLLAVTLTAFAAVAGCSKPGDSAPQSEASASPPAAAAIAETPAADLAKGANNLLSATPGSASCETGSIAKLDWDVASNPAIAQVELMVGTGDDAKLFSAGGPKGEAETGPWVRSGTTFVLRNKADQAELDRIVISGPACPVSSEAPAQ